MPIFASLRVNFRAELNRRFVPIFCLSKGQFQGRIKPKVCADFFAFRKVNFRAELNRRFVPIFLPLEGSISRPIFYSFTKSRRFGTSLFSRPKGGNMPIFRLSESQFQGRIKPKVCAD